MEREKYTDRHTGTQIDTERERGRERLTETDRENEIGELRRYGGSERGQISKYENMLSILCIKYNPFNV